MRTLKTGEACPICGQPIPLTDEMDLLLLTCECVLLGLLPKTWLDGIDGDAQDERPERARR